MKEMTKKMTTTRRSFRRPARAAGAAATAVALSVLAGACGIGGDTPEAPATTGSGQPVPTTAQERSTVETLPPTSAAPPKKQTLTLEQRHPNGTVLRLTGISFAATSMAITVEAVNGYTEKIQLNSDGVQLRDSVGNSYNFVAPEQNKNLEILPGATLRGDLTFLGELDRKATTLKLLVNVRRSEESVDLAARSDSSRYPKFQIDNIPITR